LDLAGSLCRRVQEVVNAIPLSQIVASGARVFIPAIAFLKETLDAEPLLIKGTVKNAGMLPDWLQLDSATGVLSSTKNSISEDLRLQIEFHHMHTRRACWCCAVRRNTWHRERFETDARSAQRHRHIRGARVRDGNHSRGS